MYGYGMLGEGEYEQQSVRSGARRPEAQPGGLNRVQLGLGSREGAPPMLLRTSRSPKRARLRAAHGLYGRHGEPVDVHHHQLLALVRRSPSTLTTGRAPDGLVCVYARCRCRALGTPRTRTHAHARPHTPAPACTTLTLLPCTAARQPQSLSIATPIFPLLYSPILRNGGPCHALLVPSPRPFRLCAPWGGGSSTPMPPPEYTRPEPVPSFWAAAARGSVRALTPQQQQPI